MPGPGCCGIAGGISTTVLLRLVPTAGGDQQEPAHGGLLHQQIAAHAGHSHPQAQVGGWGGVYAVLLAKPTKRIASFKPAPPPVITASVCLCGPPCSAAKARPRTSPSATPSSPGFCRARSRVGACCMRACVAHRQAPAGCPLSAHTWLAAKSATAVAAAASSHRRLPSQSAALLSGLSGHLPRPLPCALCRQRRAHRRHLHHHARLHAGRGDAQHAQIRQQARPAPGRRPADNAPSARSAVDVASPRLSYRHAHRAALPC